MHPFFSFHLLWEIWNFFFFNSIWENLGVRQHGEFSCLINFHEQWKSLWWYIEKIIKSCGILKFTGKFQGQGVWAWKLRFFVVFKWKYGLLLTIYGTEKGPIKTRELRRGAFVFAPKHESGKHLAPPHYGMLHLKNKKKVYFSLKFSTGIKFHDFLFKWN